MAFEKAVRRKAKARVGFCGPAGSGKTASSLRFAGGLAEGGVIIVIDTEQLSSSWEVDRPGVPEFMNDEIPAPYTIDKYIAKIDEALKLNPAVIIIDSISHAWAGEGGILDNVDRIKSAGGNQMLAWREMTPKHNKFVNKLLTAPCHVIVTMRSKTDTIIEKDERTGKMSPRKVALQAVQRDGLDYEFTLVFDVAQNSHLVTANKDRTGIFDTRMPEMVTRDHGKLLLDYLNSGAVIEPAPVPEALLREETVEVARPVETRVRSEVNESPPKAPGEKMLSTAAKTKLSSLASDAGYFDLKSALDDIETKDKDLGEFTHDNLTINQGIKIAAILKERIAAAKDKE